MIPGSASFDFATLRTNGGNFHNPPTRRRTAQEANPCPETAQESG